MACAALSLITCTESTERDGREAFWCFLQLLTSPAARKCNVRVAEDQLRPGLTELALGGSITAGDVEEIVTHCCVPCDGK